MENLSGSSYNSWDVLYKQHKGSLYACICACGYSRTISGYDLKFRTNSCQNCSIKNKRMACEKEFVGKVFGRLLVFKFVGLKRQRNHFLCKCLCGKEVITDTYSLESGNTSSCGCLRTESLKSESVRLKISQKNKGRIMLESTKLALVLANKGKIVSTKTRKKQSTSRKGKLTGPNNPNWKPPEQRKYTLKKSIRQCQKYVDWRTSVFIRDGRRCQICSSNKDIQADHIKPFAKILRDYEINSLEDSYLCEELWSIKNGRTLCEECHRKTETYGNSKFLKKDVTTEFVNVDGPLNISQAT